MSPRPRLYALERAFAGDVRQRGEEYFHERRVRLQELAHDRVWGSVRGSYTYFVAAVCHGTKLRAWCQCPYIFERDEPCKHLWAALRRAEEAGALSDLALSPNTELVLDSTALEALDERPRSSAALHWRDLVVLAKHERPQPSLADLELAAFIDLHEARTTGSLAVRLGRRRVSVTGSGRLDPLEADVAPERFVAPLDRLLVELSVGSPNGYGADCLLLESASIAELLPRLCASGRLRVLDSEREPLGEIWRHFVTGVQSRRRSLREWHGGRPKRVMREIDYEPLLALPALAWDEGAPWRLVLRLAAESAQAYRIFADLVRGAERVDVREPDLIHAVGLVFAGAKLARAELGTGQAWLSAVRANDPVLVPASEVEELVARHAELPAAPELELPPELGYEVCRVEPVRLLDLSAPGTRGVDGIASLEYAGQRLRLGTPGLRTIAGGERKIIVRDGQAEQRARDALIASGFRGAALHEPEVGPHEAGVVRIASKRLTAAVLELLGAGWTVVGEGVRYRAASAASARVSAGIDWFELDGTVTFGELELPLPKLLRALRKARGSSRILLGDGSIGVLPDEWLARWGALAEATPGKDGEPIRYARAQIGIVEGCLSLLPQNDTALDAAFCRLRDELSSFEQIEPAEPAPEFVGELRPYQRLGLGWLGFLERLGFGACLADDMGLGKTVQLLAHLGRGRGPSLVVVPRSLVFNWLDEARRFAPSLRVHVYAGANRSAEHGFVDWDVVLTTYGTLRRDAAELAKLQFEHVILDEAQNIKNPASATAKAARALSARQRIALSGTPIENHLGELVSLFEFLNPGLFAGLPRLTHAIRGRAPSPETCELVRRAVRPFILRRTKAQVARDLPARSEQTLLVELDAEHRALYDELLEHYRNRVRSKLQALGPEKATPHVFEALLRLRQAACHPGLLDSKRREESSAKLDVLLDKLAELVEEGHKALVFSQFTSLLDLVRVRLDAARIDYEYLDGQTRDRKARVERFQSALGPNVFLLSLKAGGVGLNLTEADYVFILDPWWNPAVEAQAIDRTHRIGQTRSIIAYRILAADTVEQRVAELQARKRELVSAIINQDGELGARLSRGDLELVLGLEPAAVEERPPALVRSRRNGQALSRSR